jgi:hypothetical protein
MLQVPSEHVAVPFSTPGHRRSHEPQLDGLDARSKQPSAQRVKPFSHRKSQLLWMQIATPFVGAPQALPHAPQFCASFVRLVHVPPQDAS